MFFIKRILCLNEKYVRFLIKYILFFERNVIEY